MYCIDYNISSLLYYYNSSLISVNYFSLNENVLFKNINVPCLIKSINYSIALLIKSDEYKKHAPGLT